jgi:HK97 gp10 family phage protein
MSSSSVTVKFDLLPAIAAQLEHKAAEAIGKAALDIEARAKQLAPVDTGNLRNSITAEQQGTLAWIVAVGAVYGIYQEYGTHKMAASPYLTPAFMAVAPALIEALGSIVG